MTWAILLLLSAASLHAAQPVISPPANFGLGENLKTIASEIDERETPSSNNMINTISGAAEKRDGSRFYIAQAYSTNPFTSLIRVYGSTSSVDVKKVLIATTRDRILTSTPGVNPVWLVVSSGNPHNTHWDFTTTQNKVLMVEDSLQADMMRYDIMTGSMTQHVINFDSSETVKIRGKHILNVGDQILLANVALISTNTLSPGTTYYNSRMYYTPILFPSSFTYQRYLSFGEDDGEELTGISSYKGVYLWKPSKVFKLTYTDLRPAGDMEVQVIVNGFGLFAPRSLAFTGDFFILGDKGSIRLWDGAEKTRLEVEQESRVVSDKIQPIIDRCIQAGTWKDASAIWYPARRWYMLSVEDPALNPKGRQNLTMVLDLDTLSWFRFTNWDVASWTVWDSAGDNGELQYGSSSDGYVIFADDKISANDARRELPVNNFDRVADWAGGYPEVTTVAEGTASVRMTPTTSQKFSSVTYMAVINVGEWMDKRRIDKDDKLSFKVFPTSVANIISLRVDLEIEDVRDTFNLNFTSVTLSSGAFTSGATTWNTIEIDLSSFPILGDWVNLSSETLPFADTLTFFGIRFQSTGIAGFSMLFDDLRIVDDEERPLSAFRWTKQFNFGAASKKEFKEVYLNADLAPDSELFIDVFKDFGSFVDRRTISGDFSKEIFVAGYNGVPNLTKLDSISFRQVISTEAVDKSAFSIESMAVDEDFVYAGDQFNNRILKIDKSSFTLFVTTFGSIGASATNFNLISQLAVDRNFLYVADLDNHRVQVLNKSDLTFSKSFGQLGNSATSFHLPQGIAVDGDAGNLYVANDGNYNILKLDSQTGDLKLSVDLDLDTFGEPSLAVDDKNLFVAYRSFSPNSLDSLELILEKRDKSSLEILDKTTVFPMNSVALSTYAFEGDISLSGRYIYMAFTDDANGNGKWYIQKRLKDDFSIVKEASFPRRISSIAVNELSFIPARKTINEVLGSEGRYLQLKYAEGDSLDNSFKLYNQAFKLVPEEVSH